MDRDFDFKAPDVFTVQNCDIDLTVDSDDETNSEEKVDKIVTSPREKLSYSDLKTISDCQMLTDNVINLLQKMLKQVFVDAMGFQAYESVQGEGGCFFKDVRTLFKKNSALFFHDIFLQKSFNFFGMKLGLSHSVLKSIECCGIFPISIERVLLKKSNKIIRLSY